MTGNIFDKAFASLLKESPSKRRNPAAEPETDESWGDVNAQYVSKNELLKPFVGNRQEPVAERVDVPRLSPRKKPVPVSSAPPKASKTV